MRSPGGNRRGRGAAEPDNPGQRIDRWLWHARFARTRATAQRLALSGHVRVNRERVTSASRTVRVGDVLTIALGAGVRVVAVSAIADRRGPAGAARQLYEDRTSPAGPPPREHPRPARPVPGPRPDRRARRAGAAMKRGEME